MARLVFGVHGLRGSLNNTLGLARQLLEVGHEVHVVGFRDIGVAVEHVGATYHQLREGPDARRRYEETRRRRGLVRGLVEARRGRERVLGLAEPVGLLEDLRPDLCVVDLELHGLVLAARHLDLPGVSVVPWHDVFRSARRPPMHTDLAPPETRLDRARIRVAWDWLRLRRRLARGLGPLRPAAALAKLLPPQLNAPDPATVVAMADRLGLDLDAMISRNEWVHPHTYIHQPVMSYTAAEFELDDGPFGVRHVGPIVDPGRYTVPLPPEDEDRLAALLDGARTRGRRLAYCSMGSLQPANRDYYQRVVDAFAALPDWDLVIGLGGRSDGSDLALPRDSVLALAEAPQLRILEHAHVAIHPAGTGTFYECVRAGVPSIVLHTGHVDMPGVAARVAHHGLGVRLDRSTATPADIGSAAVELADGRCADGLAWGRSVVADHEARRPGVALVEELLTG